MKVKIRDARIEDAPALTKIAWAAKQSWGYPEAWLRRWTDGLRIDESVLGAMKVRIAEAEDEGILGFYALAGSGPIAQLEHLWVRPAMMGRGVGRTLVEHAVETALSSGATEMVIEADPHAEAFYVKLGAERIGAVPAPVPGAENRTLPLLSIQIK